MGDLNHEPSMEEILASIKRIIAEDGEGPPAAARKPRGRAAPVSDQPDASDPAEEEVLELTHRIDPPAPDVQPVNADAIPAASVVDDPIAADESSEPPVPAPAPHDSHSEEPPRAAEPADDPADRATVADAHEQADEAAEEPLVSAAARQASRQAIAALSTLVVRPDPPGSDTLEGMVREMLRPMLKDWLDARLPALVEQVVAREIARIVEGRG